MYEFINVTHQDKITTITLNRPKVHNSINSPMHQELQAAFDDFAQDDRQYICVVTGAGERAFCAGSDLKAAIIEGLPASYPQQGYAGLIERFDMDKPIIAAVNGLALGGGFEIALACDIIIASQHACFGLPEPLVGAIALGGGLHRLARQIGLKQAMGYSLTGRQMSAEEGFRLGLVNAVVDAADLQSTVESWCEDILRGAPLSIRASKQTIMYGLDAPDLATAIKEQHQYPAFKTWQQAEDTREGPRAFAQKRRPNWKGR